MARTKRESEEKRSGRLVGAAENSKKLAEWRRLQRKNLKILGLPKRTAASVPQREQLASMPEPPLPKGKEPFEVKVSKSRTLARKGDQSGSMGRKEWTSQ